MDQSTCVSSQRVQNLARTFALMESQGVIVEVQLGPTCQSLVKQQYFFATIGRSGTEPKIRIELNVVSPQPFNIQNQFHGVYPLYFAPEHRVGGVNGRGMLGVFCSPWVLSNSEQNGMKKKVVRMVQLIQKLSKAEHFVFNQLNIVIAQNRKLKCCVLEEQIPAA